MNNKIMLNKKADAGDFAMIFSFIFLLLIVGVGIVAGVIIVFGSEYDFRQAEAETLNYAIKNCISENQDYFSSITKDTLKNELYGKCRLNKDVVEKNNIIKIDRNDEILFLFGDSVKCGIKGNENYPKCSQDTLIIKSNNNDISFSILTGSSQRAGRI